MQGEARSILPPLTLNLLTRLPMATKGVSGDKSVMALFARLLGPRQRPAGVESFDVVERWLDQSLADRRIEHHATMDGGPGTGWHTQHGPSYRQRLPPLIRLPVTRSHVNWAQIYVFRVKNAQVVEHWAIRDDLSVLEQISRADSPAPGEH